MDSPHKHHIFLSMAGLKKVRSGYISAALITYMQTSLKTITRGNVHEVSEHNNEHS